MRASNGEDPGTKKGSVLQQKRATIMGYFSAGDLWALQALIECLLFIDKITKFLSVAQEEFTKRSVQVVASVLSFFLPGLTLAGTVNYGQRTIRTHSATQIRPEAEDFKIRMDKNVLTIELFDGGVCLDVDDDVCLNHPVQQAISAAWSQSTFPIEKLDICASFIRADLDAKKIFSLLKIMPSNLQYLQLGGISLSVPALTSTLLHPRLTALKVLKLYDVEFLQADNNDNVQLTEENTESNITLGLSPLRKVVCLFLRLEAGVTLDPLLKSLKRAPKLEHFELVMDHNHVYSHGQSRLQNASTAEIFGQSCFGDFLTAARQLKTLILEYVPLRTLHLCAMAQSLRNSQRLKELCLVDAPQDSPDEGRSWVPIADFFRIQTTLHTVSLDGITKEVDDMSIILQGLAHSGSIHDLRLRNLPLQLDALSSCLRMNSAVAALSLHSNAFEGISSDIQGTVYNSLLQVLETQNITLKRISWKSGRCTRTEVFPRRRKPKIYRCCTNQLPSIAPVSTWQVQQRIQWFLTLNQRGIRSIMADVDHSANEFLNIVLQQQREETQEALPSGEYDLDCLFYLLSTNPSFIKTS